MHALLAACTLLIAQVDGSNCSDAPEVHVEDCILSEDSGGQQVLRAFLEGIDFEESTEEARVNEE